MVGIIKDLLEKYDEGDGSEIVLNLIFVSLISSDNLIDEESCRKSRNRLEEFKEAVKLADVGKQTKSDWLNRIKDGFEIIARDEAELTA